MSDWIPPKSLGKYELVSPLGQGGMGVVWRARHTELGRDVAIKVMLAGEHASEEMLARFRREARLAAKLQDPGIVTVFDCGNEGRLHYFVMELVEGQSLKELLANGPLPVDRAVRIAAEAARALGAAHDSGVVHRDVKPGNLLIDTKGRVRVADFGLAKDLSDASLTATGTVVGTPSYMAPEQAAGETSLISPRTDVYALGAVLYEMLTGRPPFTGTALAVLRQIDAEAPTSPSTRNSAIPSAVEAVVMRALAKEPENRYANARELAMALENPSSMAPTMIRPSAARKRATTTAPAAASRWPWLVVAAVVLLAAGLGWNRLKPAPGPAAGSPGPSTPPGPVNPPQPGPGPVATVRTGLRGVLDRLAEDPLRWAATGAMPLPTSAEIEAAKKEEPDANRRRFLEALRLVYLGDKDKAMETAETAFGQAPKGDADAALVLGEVLLLAHRWSGANMPLDDALDRIRRVTPPEPIDVAVLRAVVLISRREEYQAQEACASVFNREHDSARFYALEALRYQGLAQFASARQKLAKGMSLDPTLEDRGYDAFLGWVDAFSHRAWDGMCEQVLLEATKGRPWPLAHLLTAWMAVHRSDWDGAAEEMKEFERTRPQLWPALEPEELHVLAAARMVRARQAVAGVATFVWFGEWEEAAAAGKRARELAGEGVDQEGREETLRDLEFWLAAGCAAKEEIAEGLTHAQAYLDHGGEKANLEARENLKPLLDDSGWKALRENPK